jgi:hypothetical protein
MAQEAPPQSKIPTAGPRCRTSCRAGEAWCRSGRPDARGRDGRAAARGGRPVIELENGITVYPAREERGPQDTGRRQLQPREAPRRRPTVQEYQ